MNLSCLHYILLASLAAPFSSFALPQPDEPAKATADSLEKGPRIQFKDPVLDFGKIEAGQVVTNEFIFTNTGSEPLEIKEVKASCGCTVPADWTKTVEPGKTGRIPFMFRSASFSSDVHKSITVVSNDPKEGKVVLQLKGNVWKSIEVTPAFAIFNISPDMQSDGTRVIKIKSNLDEPLTLSPPVVTNNSFKASLKTIREGKEYELLVTANPPFEKKSVSTTITLNTSNVKVPVLKATANASIRPTVTVTPSQITLPLGTLAEPKQFTVKISNNSTNALELRDPQVDAPGVELLLIEVSTGKEFALTGSFPAGFSYAKSRFAINLKSSDSKSPVLRIPIIHPSRPDRKVDARTRPKQENPDQEIHATRQGDDKSAAESESEGI